MNKKILALLESKFQGTRKDVLTNLASTIALQADTEEEATEIVGKLTADKVAKYQQEYRSSIDREVQQANQTLENNLRKQYDFKEKNAVPEKEGDQPKQQTGGLTLDDIEALFNKQLKPLKDRLDASDLQKAAATRRETYVGKLKAAKLNESIIETMAGQFDRMSFKDDADFEAYLNESQPTIDRLAQQAADDALRRSPSASFGKTNDQGVSDNVAAYVAQKQAKESDLGGKEI